MVTYDAQGRVLTYQVIGNSTHTFNYTSALAAQCVLSLPSDPNRTTYNIYLNSNGTVASMNNSIVIGGFTYDYYYTFHYNTEGRINRCDQKVENVSGGSVSFNYDSMVYENGSLTKQYTFGAATLSGPYSMQKYSITTNTDQANKISYHPYNFVGEPISTVSGFQAFYHLFGKGSDRLPAETNIYTPSGTLSYKINYTHLLNENGYLTEENITRSIIAPGTENRRFYYSCK